MGERGGVGGAGGGAGSTGGVPPESAVREPARVAAVRATGLLDTAAEEVFDRLSRLAVHLVGVPAAFLSLVDAERDFYKSACGFGEPLAGVRELTGPTFCHLAIASPGPLVIPDTAADPAYRDLPTVRTLGVAAYVGVPIAIDGQRVGSFCAIDTRPRAWTADEVETLATLAASAQREIELRGALARADRLAAERTRLLADSVAARRDAEAARAAADAEQRRLALILDQLPVGVVVVDATAAVVHLNAACDAVLGTSLKPVAGLGDYAVHGGGLHPDGRPYAAEDYPIARAVLHGEVVSQELTRYRRGDGRVTTLSISAAPVRDAEGRIAYAVAAVEDVSQLEAARAEAQAANRAKGEFLAVMSHELRTPLNAIGGYAELMEMGIRGPITEQQREDLGRIQRSQRHLLGLVNEVLNYAKLETGTVRYDAADVVLCGALAEAEALVAPQARAKGLTLAAAECPASLTVRADPEKLRQVLVNLLSNAVKFTEARDGERGRITVACAAAGDRVSVVVRDTGIGIPADKLDAVFEPFVQVRADLTRTAEGTGLGLAISRDLARGMGGDLNVESTFGHGSTFTLTLPRAAVGAEERSQPTR